MRLVTDSCPRRLAEGAKISAKVKNLATTTALVKQVMVVDGRGTKLKSMFVTEAFCNQVIAYFHQVSDGVFVVGLINDSVFL